MTAGTESHPNDPHVEALGKVRQVTLPPAARALSTLSHVDYEDAFLVETGSAQDRTGERVRVRRMQARNNSGHYPLLPAGRKAAAEHGRPVTALLPNALPSTRKLTE